MCARAREIEPTICLRIFQKRIRQAHARIAIMRALKNYNQNPEMQNIFAEHFREIETHFHASAQTDPQNPAAPIFMAERSGFHFMTKENPADRVKALEDHLYAQLPNHVKDVIRPKPRPIPGNVEDKKPEASKRIGTPKYRHTLYSKNIIYMLAPEAAPLDLQRSSLDQIQD